MDRLPILSEADGIAVISAGHELQRRVAKRLVDAKDFLASTTGLRCVVIVDRLRVPAPIVLAPLEDENLRLLRAVERMPTDKR